jgi:hypothetical protein
MSVIKVVGADGEQIGQSQAEALIEDAERMGDEAVTGRTVGHAMSADPARSRSSMPK